MNGWWWHMSGMWIFWIALILLAVLSVRWLSNSPTGRERSPESPIDVLKRRYAQGEIEKEEYERKLADLRR